MLDPRSDRRRRAPRSRCPPPAAAAAGTARRYMVELDNAFGMVEGGDVRVAGVNAGRSSTIELDERTLKALVEVEIDRARASARCARTCSARRGRSRRSASTSSTACPARRSARSRPAAASGREHDVHDPARPVQNIDAPALPRALPADPERVRRRPGRPARGPERRDPPRRPGAAPDVARCSRSWPSTTGSSATWSADADRVIGKLADEPPRRRPLRGRGRATPRARRPSARDDIAHELPASCRASSRS